MVGALDTESERWDGARQARAAQPPPCARNALDTGGHSHRWNAYAYVANQPLTATDPLGLCPGGCGGQQMGGGDPLTPSARCEVEGLPDNCWLDPGTISFAIIPSAGFGGGVTAGGVGRVGMQTEQLPPELIELAPAQSQGCAQPNFVQKVGIAAQAWLARLTGHDIGIGAGGSGGIGHIFGVAGDVSRQMIVSPNGQAAIVTTFAATPPPLGLVEGAGVFGGLQFSVGSPTSSPAELASPAVVGSFGGGDGLGAGLDVAAGPSGWEGTLTLGGGAGLEGNGGAALIAPAPVVTPVCTQ